MAQCAIVFRLCRRVPYVSVRPGARLVECDFAGRTQLLVVRISLEKWPIALRKDKFE
jgi:hypothetical protein